MLENNGKLELNKDELSNVSAGKSVVDIIETLLPLTSQYPEIVEMVHVYQKGDYAMFLTLLQRFTIAHPELANIFED